MPVTLHEQEARRDTLSGAVYGQPITVTQDATNAADVAVIHAAAAECIDCVWIQVHNAHTADVTLNLAVNPADTTVLLDITSTAIPVSIPALGSLWVLQGDTVRLRGSNTWAIAAYVATGDAGRLRVTGYVVRTRTASLY